MAWVLVEVGVWFGTGKCGHQAPRVQAGHQAQHVQGDLQTVPECSVGEDDPRILLGQEHWV